MTTDTTPTPPMSFEHFRAVAQAVESILIDNEGNRITTALRVGVIAVLQRVVPHAEPSAEDQLRQAFGLPPEAIVRTELRDAPHSTPPPPLTPAAFGLPVEPAP